jgi:hypothetical protein
VISITSTRHSTQVKLIITSISFSKSFKARPNVSLYREIKGSVVTVRPEAVTTNADDIVTCNGGGKSRDSEVLDPRVDLPLLHRREPAKSNPVT